MSLQFSNHVLDNVHGFIPLTKVEDEIERLPIFRRLRNIKQLGLANWIFPGSEHTRYIHSLGVMHIIGQMANKLNFSDEDTQLVRLAGMLHDIGHYPLSHIGEYAYMQRATQNKNHVETACDDVVDKVEKLTDTKILNSVLMQGQPNPFHHENMGVSVIMNSSAIKELIHKYYDDRIDILDICDIIVGNTERNPDLSAKIQLLHSELDADRIDYLLRDASFSGAGYGKIELGTLIKSLEVKKHSTLDVEIVGISPKGIGSADQFLINRYLAYSQVIFHKHVSVLSYMAESVISWMINETTFNEFPSGDALADFIKKHERNTKYLDFTDQYFHNILHKVSISNDGCPPEIYILIEHLRKGMALPVVGKQIAFSSRNREELKKLILGTTIYQNAAKKDPGGSKRLPLMHTISITNNVPLQQFNEAYETFIKANNPDEVPEIESFYKQRLQNGVAVIEEDTDPYLLVDSTYSLTKDLSLNTQVLLREYGLYD